MKKNIKEFFDDNYRNNTHYWWKNDNRYSTDENDHTPYYSHILGEAKKIKSGKVLDLGGGEGADAIRLAKIGFHVDVVELSSVGCQKIHTLADEMKLPVNVICSDIRDYTPLIQYEIVMCNGVLHYVEEKEAVIYKMQKATKPNGINCISVFSDYTPVPLCHQIVPVYPAVENGVIEQMYDSWSAIYSSYDRNKKELSHTEMDEHVHSFIKKIWRKIDG